MSRLARTFVLLALAAGCDRESPVTGPRPSQPTLTAALDRHAPATGRRIVAAVQIVQPWHVGVFSPASITLPQVEAGDAIVVLGVYWGDLPRGSDTAPTDDRGTLRSIVDQAAFVLGRSKPPVFAQLYAELDAAPGPHTIVPPYLGGVAGDGTMYVVQIRGLTERSVIATGQNRVVATAQRGVSVALQGLARPGDLAIALGGYDNTAPAPSPGWTHPPGWTVIGTQDDASNNVPSSLCSAVAPYDAATWAWSDPTVNVAVALIVTLR